MRNAGRVLLCGDFQLAAPVRAAPELPPAVQTLLAQARERAALNVFDAAQAQGVDWLILCGELADLEAEPRLAAWLRVQFRRMLAAGIKVVWACPGGTPENRLWIPDGVVLLDRHSRPISFGAGVLGWTAGLSDSLKGDFALALSPGGERFRLDCRTLRGQASVQEPLLPPQGTGPAPSETGAWLLEFTPQVSPRCTRIATEAVRWRRESFSITPDMTSQSLRAHIAARNDTLSRSGAALTLVRWEAIGAGPLWELLLDDAAARQIFIEHPSQSKTDVRDWDVRFHPAAEQFRAWSEQPATAQGLRELEQLSAADVAAALSGQCWPEGTAAGAEVPAGLPLRVVQALRQQNPAAAIHTLSGRTCHAD